MEVMLIAVTVSSLLHDFPEVRYPRARHIATTGALGMIGLIAVFQPPLMLPHDSMGLYFISLILTLLIMGIIIAVSCAVTPHEEPDVS